MAEHRIRLRGGWQWHGRESPSGMSLPIVWPAGLDGRIRLVRKFGRPPAGARGERLSLLMDAVPGLLAVWLNDREIARPTPGTSRLELALEPALPARNVLVLEVDPGAMGVAVAEAEWGQIALVIASAEG